ncbi:MAG: sigma-70 family RNA polymerase sigma factor [Candidatus Obscuribacterales bacterium]|nr:sigma-70 family RNA polymerase sigma factor [Cyanobacteria bacterium HKST-UBA01]MCB9467629.1 sigma-70 family RNA polymerase sigma factor [Candidatus Obscuribacterales bacterium]
MATSYSQKSDRDLVMACQRREPAAFEELVKRHQKTVYVLLYQLAPDWTDTSDLAQEVFIRVWRSITNLRNPNAFRSWLTQIVTNIFYDELRKRPRKLPTVSMDEPYTDEESGESTTRDIPDESLVPEEKALNKELSQIIRESMMKLPEQFRTAIVLREVEGLSYEEIAVITKTEMGTVKSRIARARTKLQEMLKPYLESQESTSEVSS